MKTRRFFICGRAHCIARQSGVFKIYAWSGVDWSLLWGGREWRDVLDHIKYLNRLAAQRERRKIVADLCGTSYAEARRDGSV